MQALRQQKLRSIRSGRTAYRAPSRAQSLRSVSSRFQTRLRWALKPGWKFFTFPTKL